MPSVRLPFVLTRVSAAGSMRAAQGPLLLLTIFLAGQMALVPAAFGQSAPVISTTLVENECKLDLYWPPAWVLTFLEKGPPDTNGDFAYGYQAMEVRPGVTNCNNPSFCAQCQILFSKVDKPYQQLHKINGVLWLSGAVALGLLGLAAGPATAVGIALLSGAGVFATTGGIFGLLAADPPDLVNYQSVYQYPNRNLSFDWGLSSSANAYLNQTLVDLAKTSDALNGELVSGERYQGALANGDTASAATQQQAAGSFEQDYEAFAKQAAADLRGLPKVLSQEGVTDVPFDPVAFGAGLSALSQNGVPPSLAQILVQLEDSSGPSNFLQYELSLSGSTTTDTAFSALLAAANAVATVPLACDVNGDGFVDQTDIQLIADAVGTPASGPDDPRDFDHDGMITVLDTRGCTLDCNNDLCAPQAQAASQATPQSQTTPQALSCGMLGAEPAVGAALILWFRRRRRPSL